MNLNDELFFFKVISQMLIVLFSSAGALIFALSIAFKAGWKLTLVVLCFTPLLVLSGYLQGRSQSKAARSKTAKSFAEQAGKVFFIILCSFEINNSFSKC